MAEGEDSIVTSQVIDLINIIYDLIGLTLLIYQ